MIRQQVDKRNERGRYAETPSGDKSNTRRYSLIIVRSQKEKSELSIWITGQLGVNHLNIRILTCGAEYQYPAAMVSNTTGYIANNLTASSVEGVKERLRALGVLTRKPVLKPDCKHVDAWYRVWTDPTLIPALPADDEPMFDLQTGKPTLKPTYRDGELVLEETKKEEKKPALPPESHNDEKVDPEKVWKEVLRSCKGNG